MTMRPGVFLVVLALVVSACGEADGSAAASESAAPRTTVAVESPPPTFSTLPPGDVEQLVGSWRFDEVKGAEGTDLVINLDNGLLLFDVNIGVLSASLRQGPCVSIFGGEISSDDGRLEIRSEYESGSLDCPETDSVPILEVTEECLWAGCLYEFGGEQKLRLFLPDGVTAELARCERDFCGL